MPDASAADQSESPTSPVTGLSESQQPVVMEHIRAQIQAAVTGVACSAKLPTDMADALVHGVFITIRRRQVLRACRGRWGQSGQALGPLLAQVAHDTAISDVRFPSVTKHELPFLCIDLSLMYDFEQVQQTGSNRVDAVEVGTHGLVINHPAGRGLLLPHVATEAGWDAETFLNHTAQKAGLPPDAWQHPKASLLTFKTQLVSDEPEEKELSPQDLTRTLAQQLVNAGNECLRATGDKPRAKPAGNESEHQHAAELGLAIHTTSGAMTAAFGRGLSLGALIEKAIQTLKGSKSGNALDDAAIARLTLYLLATPLRAADYPRRHTRVPQQAVLARSGDRWSLTPPAVNAQGHWVRPGDPIATAMSSVGLTMDTWAAGDAEHRGAITAFYPFTIDAQRAGGSDSNPSAPPPTETQIRPAARAGQFYPAEASEIDEMIHGFLAAGKDQPDQPDKAAAPPKRVSAVMLPHAGWKYCGATMGKTLAQVQVPKTVIIIGPKHTPNGPDLSVAPHQKWEFPGGSVPLHTELAKRLADALPGAVLEPHAHQSEHCCEVILPFLAHLQPDLRVVPVVIGGASTFSRAVSLAEGLAVVLAELNDAGDPPLVVISSDMNHFAPEEENRRLDHLAIDAMLTGDPERLYNCCQQNHISMCGLMPAVTVMRALHATGRCTATLVDYSNSAAASGDKSKVVGYAGVFLESAYA